MFPICQKPSEPFLDVTETRNRDVLLTIITLHYMLRLPRWAMIALSIQYKTMRSIFERTVVYTVKNSFL
jgi:hypothetical protein